MLFSIAVAILFAAATASPAIAWANPPAGADCPSTSVGAASVYDASSGRSIFFGGEVCYTAAAEATNLLCGISPGGQSVTALDNSADDPSYVPSPTMHHCCAIDSATSIMYCFGGTSKSTTLFQYSIPLGRWLAPKSSSYTPTSRREHACAVVGSVFYSWGGVTQSGDDLSDSFIQYDLTTSKTWTVLPTFGAERHGHSLIGVGRSLFVLFGASYSSSSAAPPLPIYLYNIDSKSWVQYNSAYLPAIADGVSCTSWSSIYNTGGIFCAGGISANMLSYSSSLYYLDLSTSTWFNLGSAPGMSVSTPLWKPSVSLTDYDSVLFVRGGGAPGVGIVGTRTWSTTNYGGNVPADSCSSSGIVFYGVTPYGPLSGGSPTPTATPGAGTPTAYVTTVPPGGGTFTVVTTPGGGVPSTYTTTVPGGGIFTVTTTPGGSPTVTTVPGGGIPTTLTSTVPGGGVVTIVTTVPATATTITATVPGGGVVTVVTTVPVVPTTILSTVPGGGVVTVVTSVPVVPGIPTTFLSTVPGGGVVTVVTTIPVVPTGTAPTPGWTSVPPGGFPSPTTGTVPSGTGTATGGIPSSTGPGGGTGTTPGGGGTGIPPAGGEGGANTNVVGIAVGTAVGVAFIGALICLLLAYNRRKAIAVAGGEEGGAASAPFLATVPGTGGSEQQSERPTGGAAFIPGVGSTAHEYGSTAPGGGLIGGPGAEDVGNNTSSGGSSYSPGGGPIVETAGRMSTLGGGSPTLPNVAGGHGELFSPNEMAAVGIGAGVIAAGTTAAVIAGKKKQQTTTTTTTNIVTTGGTTGGPVPTAGYSTAPYPTATTPGPYGGSSTPSSFPTTPTTSGPVPVGSTTQNTYGSITPIKTTTSTNSSAIASPVAAVTSSSSTHVQPGGLSTGATAAIIGGAVLATAAGAAAVAPSKNPESVQTTSTKTTTVSSGNVTPVGYTSTASSSTRTTVPGSIRPVPAGKTTTVTTTTVGSTDATNVPPAGVDKTDVSTGVIAGMAGAAVVAGAVVASGSQKTTETTTVRVKRFLITLKQNKCAFDLRTFEAKAQLLKKDFDTEKMLESVVASKKPINSGVVSEYLKAGGLDVPEAKKQELVKDLIGPTGDSSLVFENLKETLIDVGGPAVFLGTVYSMTTEPRIRKDQVTTIMKTFVSDIKQISPSARFDLPAFVAKAKLERPRFDATDVLPLVERNPTYPYTVQAFRSDLHHSGLDVSSPRVYKDYLITLCGPSASTDAPKVLHVFSKTVKLVGHDQFGKTVYTVLGQSTTTTADAPTVINRFLRSVSLVSPPASRFDIKAFEATGQKLNPRFSSKIFLDRLLASSKEGQTPNSPTGGEFTTTKVSKVLQAAKISPVDASPGSDSYNRLMVSLTGIESTKAPTLPTQSAEKVVSLLEDAIKTIGVDAFLSGLPAAQAEFERQVDAARAPSPADSFDEPGWLNSLPSRPSVVQPPNFGGDTSTSTSTSITSVSVKGKSPGLPGETPTGQSVTLPGAQTTTIQTKIVTSKIESDRNPSVGSTTRMEKVDSKASPSPLMSRQPSVIPPVTAGSGVTPIKTATQTKVSITRFKSKAPPAPAPPPQTVLNTTISELQSAAPEGWFNRFARQSAAVAPSFSLPSFVYDLSDRPSSGEINQDTKLSLAASGAPMTDSQYKTILTAINPNSPDRSTQALSKVITVVKSIGPDAFLSYVVPSLATFNPADLPDDLTPQQKAAITSFASDVSQYTTPGWWSRFVAKIQEFAPNFNSLAFINGLATVTPDDTDKSSAFNAKLSEAGATLTPEQSLAVDTAVCPDRPSNAKKVHTIVTATVRRLGPKTFIETALPAVGENASRLNTSTIVMEAKSTPSASDIAIAEFLKYTETFPPGWYGRLTAILRSFNSTFSVPTFLDLLSEAPDRAPDSFFISKLKEAGCQIGEPEFSEICVVTAGSPDKGKDLLQRMATTIRITGSQRFLYDVVTKTNAAQSMPEAPSLTQETLRDDITKLHDAAPEGWWSRMITYLKGTYPSFDEVGFVGELAKTNGAPLNDDEVVKILASNGAPVSSTQFSTMKYAVNPDGPNRIGYALSLLGRVASRVSPAAFVAVIAPLIDDHSAVQFGDDEKLDAQELKVKENFVRNVNAIAAEGWWARLLRKVKQFSPSFDVGTFVKGLSEVKEPMTDAVVIQTLSTAGAPLSRDQFETVKSVLVPSKPERAVEVFQMISTTSATLGPKTFVSTVASDLAEPEKAKKGFFTVLVERVGEAASAGVSAAATGVSAAAAGVSSMLSGTASDAKDDAPTLGKSSSSTSMKTKSSVVVTPQVKTSTSVSVAPTTTKRTSVSVAVAPKKPQDSTTTKTTTTISITPGGKRVSGNPVSPTSPSQQAATPSPVSSEAKSSSSPAEGKSEGWWSRTVRAVGEGAQAVSTSAYNAGEAVIQGVGLTRSDEAEEDKTTK